MKKITWNSPVILWFALISLVVLFLDSITQGAFSIKYCCIYRTSLADPFFYLRLFTHVLGHANLNHYMGNMTIFLLVGPLLEEKYGSKKLLSIMVTVAFVTGLIHVCFFKNTALLGASGICFAFILLASITGTKHNNEIPLTFIIVGLLYAGQQIYDAIAVTNNVSHLTHLIGGCIGAVYGLNIKPLRRN